MTCGAKERRADVYDVDGLEVVDVIQLPLRDAVAKGKSDSNAEKDANDQSVDKTDDDDDDDDDKNTKANEHKVTVEDINDNEQDKRQTTPASGDSAGAVQVISLWLLRKSAVRESQP